MNYVLTFCIFSLLFWGYTLPTYAQEEQNALEIVKALPMEALYVGLSNSLDLEAKGVPPEYLRVTVEGAKISGGAGHYEILCTHTGTAVLHLSDIRNNRQTTLTLPIRHLADPVIQLDGRTDGTIRANTLKAQQGLIATFPGEDKRLRGVCKIIAYTLYYTPKHGTPIQLQGEGARFTDEIRRYIDQAKPGDQLAFVNVKVRCRWDRCSMRINGLSFMVR